MLPSRRAVDYTHFRHLSESALARISGNGWMATIAHLLGWQADLRVDSCSLTLPTPNPSLPPLRINKTTEKQTRPTTQPESIAAACRALCDLQPDILLLGGDFV